MQMQDSNSERSDNLEQIMNSDGEDMGEEDSGQNPFSKNGRRKISDNSPDREASKSNDFWANKIGNGT